MEDKRERAQSTLAAASAAAISLVLGDDNLLGEILLRLGFPTDLVRAAAVCRRWLRASSDPVFLRRFRDLHPPRILGFYIVSFPTLQRRFRTDFVPMLPRPPELAAVLRRGRFSLDTNDSQSTRVLDCRNGRVIVSLFCGGFKRGVHSPLHPARDLFIFPQLPMMDVPDSDNYSKHRIFCEILSKESVDGHGLSYFSVSLDYCVKDLCANLKISNSTTEDGDDPDAYIHMVGDDAEYVFLEMHGCVLYLDVRSRALQKVHNVTEKDTLISFIHPFMMTWPPVFPALRE